MGPRTRVTLLVAGLVVAAVVLFLVTVWVMLGMLGDGGGLGGARIAIVEIEGIIGAAAPGGVDADRIVRTLGEYRDNPSIRALLLPITSPRGVLPPTPDL